MLVPGRYGVSRFMTEQAAVYDDLRFGRHQRWPRLERERFAGLCVRQACPLVREPGGAFPLGKLAVFCRSKDVCRHQRCKSIANRLVWPCLDVRKLFAGVLQMI